MAFIAIPSSWIEAGRAIKKSLFQRISDNLDDHESRINGVEAAVEGQSPLSFSVNGQYDLLTVSDRTGLSKIVVASDITITDVKLYIDEAGTSGTTEVNVLTNTLSGPTYTTVFTIRPSVDFSSGDDAVSSNQTLDVTNVDVDAGDIIKLDITDVQASGRGLTVLIEYNFR